MLSLKPVSLPPKTPQPLLLLFVFITVLQGPSLPLLTLILKSIRNKLLVLMKKKGKPPLFSIIFDLNILCLISIKIKQGFYLLASLS